MTRLALCALAACGKLGSPSEVDGVRVLAIRAEPPYAAPGATVALDALIVDGRADTSTPLDIGWLPAPCVDPRGDAYFACYGGFGDAPLVAGSAWSFEMPSDVLAQHAGDPSYGLAYAFLVACAGQPRYAPPAAGAPANALPYGCFDDGGAPLDADQFVFAFAPVYAFADRANANPVIDHLELGGVPIDPAAGITLPRCTGKCPKSPLVTVVPPSSWELDPADIDAGGTELHEEITVHYYATAGTIAQASVVLYDPRTGALPASTAGDDLSAPAEPGDYRLWAVVHDNRGGVSWLEVPFHVE